MNGVYINVGKWSIVLILMIWIYIFYFGDLHFFNTQYFFHSQYIHIVLFFLPISMHHKPADFSIVL